MGLSAEAEKAIEKAEHTLHELRHSSLAEQEVELVRQLVAATQGLEMAIRSGARKEAHVAKDHVEKLLAQIRRLGE
jgi:hypothetical protein